MKKLPLVILLVIVFVVLGSVTGVAAAAERIGGRLVTRFVLFVHVAQLYTKDPDKKLAMPVHNVEREQIANTWQAPRDGGRRHEGQDIFAPRGTPIFSATEGYVAHIGDNSLGGQTVSVIGAGGRTYYYAHLDSYAPQLAEGDYVTTQRRRDEPIAAAQGSSETETARRGSSAHPHETKTLDLFAHADLLLSSLFAHAAVVSVAFSLLPYVCTNAAIR